MDKMKLGLKEKREEKGWLAVDYAEELGKLVVVLWATGVSDRASVPVYLKTSFYGQRTVS